MSQSREIESIFKSFSSVKVGDIREGVLPDQINQNLENLCAYFAGAPEDSRQLVTRHVTPKISFLFFIHADKMTVRAVREKNEHHLFNALVALAIENCIFDWRDSTVCMALAYHSAKLIGADPDEAFKRVASIAMPQTGARFLAFAARDQKNRSLAEFGFKESKTATGEFIYESVPFDR